jgi:hypothetical protein
MKARHEFSTDELYADYLRYYYAGQAMQGLISKGYPDGMTVQEFEAVINDSVSIANGLLEKLSN